ncbi:MAG TPA: ISL3 family transposase [Thermoanaerobaculia bacterium]|nr:ISL3 family transposase [Thermoanaerobaculia bacterium]
MRATTVLRKLVGVISLFALGMDWARGLVIEVRPTARRSRCGLCGLKAPRYDRCRARRWRHHALGGARVWLQYAPWRVRCPECGVRTEKVSWARHKSGFTRSFEENVAYLAQTTDKSTVQRVMGINWRTVGAIIERVVGDRLDAERFDDLRTIGVDEFSYRKRHRYLTVVTDHERRRVVWASEGRSSETFGKFFHELGTDRCARIETVTLDMAAGFIKALQEHVPRAEIVFDRFHVQRLVTDAVDEVRRAEVRRAGDEAQFIKGSRFALLKNPWNLTRRERTTLATVQRTNRRLYRAYLLKESLARALDYRQPGRAWRALNEWLVWALRSRLKPMVKAAKTIKKYREGILAYVRTRLTNGLVEGFNNRLRTIARRAFGFHSPEALISMLFLCCGGVELKPSLP